MALMKFPLLKETYHNIRRFFQPQQSSGAFQPRSAATIGCLRLPNVPLFQALAGVCGMCLCRAFSPCADIFQDSQYQDMGYERYTSPRAHVESLLKQRDDMEAEMEAIAGSLTRPGGPGLTGNLVDADGFPRADIDIPAVRSQRQRLAVLKTDYKALTSEIEALVKEVLAVPENEAGAHDSLQVSHEPRPLVQTGISQNHQNDANMSSQPATRPPFAIIDEVSSGSPAEEAGIRVDDRVIAFGAVSLRTMTTIDLAIQALPGLLREHENRSIDVIVSRTVPDRQPGEQEMITVKLVPRRWSGRGLLGCHVVPAPAVEDRFVPQVETAVADRTHALS